MQGFVKSRKRRLVQAVAIATAASALGAAPAQAAPDEGGAAPSSPAVQVSSGGFDWSDAGIGIAIGVGAGALAVGSTLALRRQRGDSHEAARPAVR